jgi:hypothetical protein
LEAKQRLSAFVEVCDASVRVRGVRSARELVGQNRIPLETKATVQ